MLKVTALVSLLGTMAYSCLGTEVSESFTAVVTQVAGDGSGIFDVSARSPVHGTLTFDPEAFTPNPVVPSGSNYFDVFTGDDHSADLTLWTTAGSAAIESASSFLEVSTTLNTAWELVADSEGFSWSLLLGASQGLVMSPGASLFDLPSFDASTLDLLLSNSSNSLGLEVTSISMAAPEPGSFLLLGVGTACLFGLLRLRTRAVPPGR